MQIILANKIMMIEPVALGYCINDERKEDWEIYVQDISPQQNNDRNNNGKYAAQEQPINSNGEDFKMMPLSCYPNRKRICDLQLSLEKLGYRQCTDGRKPCNLVVPNIQHKKNFGNYVCVDGEKV
ncbi:hypothetical protein RhiirA5_425381 [Rhizophagus irregularis]|uniref:Uncharacterized protein n=1 Tax=Rhizophagus irregularis TaxID=588596 RepID=A0A2N0P686_9GLOM|nr:hypothetical protein RhiirA5_425381 [Rhizophagus irregularis]CAB5178746.1 unnamed protein product [Rhizophagus irregularis]CAB5382326.1 unnamed protein product [Rhizophagus irregularis]